MVEKSYFVVCWARGAAAESRRFEEWNAAKDLFDDVIADPKTRGAQLLNGAEQKVMAFEHEPVGPSFKHRRCAGTAARPGVPS